MATDTTGSTVQGCVQGMAHGMGGSGNDIGQIIHVQGSPDGIVAVSVISGLAHDGINNQLYMATNATGNRWCTLGSVA